MFSQLSPEIYPFVRAMFASYYLMWAVLWMMVAFHYGRAAYASWLAAGGDWIRGWSDVAAPFWWAIKRTACQWGILSSPSACESEVPTPYDPATMLRFAIFLATVTPINFGLQFFVLDRTDWTYLRTTLTLVACVISCLAAGSHLFLAFRTRPEKWRKFVMTTLAGFFFGPPLAMLIYSFL